MNRFTAYMLGILTTLCMLWPAAAQASDNTAKADVRKVLVLDEGAGQHQPFVDAAMTWLRDYAGRRNFTITELHNAKPITADFLKDYDLVIQLDFPPYTWPDYAEKAFIDYIDNGPGSYIGFHHATLLGDFDGYPMWQWFSDFMGGITFRNYIAETADGTVRVEDKSHPVMQGLKGKFTLPADEWYTYDRSPRPNVHVIANVDEESYRPRSDVRMGDHPVIWTNPTKKAKNIYFQFGHSPKLLETPAFVTLLGNAIDWALEK